MPSKHDPADSLADIIENAERIESYLAGMDRSAFANNGLVRDAIERFLERVCEAAYRLGDRGAALMPDQPWPSVPTMMRHRPAGSLDPRVRKDHLSDAHAPDTDRHRDGCRHGRRP